MIVAFAGQKGAGKTTAANMLIACGFALANFADPIKGYLADLGFSHEQLYGAAKEATDERFDISARGAMQRIGEFTKKVLGDDVFINAVCTKMNENMVIGDMRFVKEANYLLSMGATVIVLERCVKKNNYSDHVSEREIDAIARLDGVHIIDNNGTVEDLREAILKIVYMST